MIEILGIKLSYDALAFIVAFVFSEVVAASKLKENSIAQLVASLIDSLKPSREEDEKVAEIKAKVEEVLQDVKNLGE